MNEKKQILYRLKIQLTSYDAGTENYVKINEEFFDRFSSNPIEELLWFMIQKGEQVNPFLADTYSNAISDSMYLRLSGIRKELSNTSPVVIEDQELSLLIFHAAVDGLMNFMRGSKQSRMDWFTTPDTVPK